MYGGKGMLDILMNYRSTHVYKDDVRLTPPHLTGWSHAAFLPPLLVEVQDLARGQFSA